MNRVKSLYEKTRTFFDRNIWLTPQEANRGYRILLLILRIGFLTVRGLQDRMIFLRASALTYSTLLALIPLLALAFSVLKGFGIHGRLEKMLVNLMVAQQEAVSQKITQFIENTVDYISNTNFTALSAGGLIVLIYAVIRMLSTVEESFNDIWGVDHARSIMRKISDYISVLIISPVLLASSLALIASLSSNTVVRKLSHYFLFDHFMLLFDAVIPLVGVWIAFTAIYIFMPNTRVRFVPALAAGIFSGTVWQAAFRIYTQFNIGVAKYNAIYGTFAAFPVFLIWVYLSWVILLFGAQISYAIQNLSALQQRMDEFNISSDQREYITLNIVLQIAQRFAAGLAPLTAEEIAQRLSLPLRLINKICNILVDQNIMFRIEMEEEEDIYQPARDLRKILVVDVLEAIREGDGVEWHLPKEMKDEQLEKLWQQKKEAVANRLRVNLLDLIDESPADKK